MRHLNKHIKLATKYILILWSCWIVSCDDIEQSEEEKAIIEREMKNREIKKITDTQLLNWSTKKGEEVSRVIQKSLNRKMNKALETGELSDFTKFDMLDRLPKTDSLAEVYNAKIIRISFENIPGDISSQEKEIVQSYQENKRTPKAQTMFVENKKKLLFTAPIILQGKLCGMWSILFSREIMIRAIDMKDI